MLLFGTKTRKYEFLTAATERNYLVTVVTKHPIDLVVMEACRPSGWINDLAVSVGLKTLVCSTNEVAWKWCNVKRKTDRDGALKLARMPKHGCTNKDCFRYNNSGATLLRFEEPPDADPHVRWCGKVVSNGHPYTIYPRLFGRSLFQLESV